MLRCNFCNRQAPDEVRGLSNGKLAVAYVCGQCTCRMTPKQFAEKVVELDVANVFVENTGRTVTVIG